MNRTQKIGLLATFTMACLLVGTVSGSVPDYVGVTQGDQYTWKVSFTMDMAMPVMPEPMYGISTDGEFNGEWDDLEMGYVNIEGEMLQVVNVTAIGADVNGTCTVTYNITAVIISWTYQVSENLENMLSEDELDDIEDDMKDEWQQEVTEDTIDIVNNATVDPADLLGRWFINKNAVNKTVPPTVEDELEGETTYTARWNADGILEEGSITVMGEMMNMTMTYALVYQGAPLIDGFTPAFLAVAALLAVPILAAKLKRKTSVPA